MKSIMIFGAGGLVGQYLVDDLFEHGYKLFCVEHNNSHKDKYRNLNIPNDSIDIQNKHNFDKLPQSGIDIVVFLAGVLPAGMEVYEPEKYFYVNTIGALNVFEYCAKIGYYITI